VISRRFGRINPPSSPLIRGVEFCPPDKGEGRRPGGWFFFAYKSWRIGMAKAAVFPVPVWAHPRKSRQERIVGMAVACMGVGVVYPSSSMARSMGSMIGSSEKSMENIYR